MDLLAEAINNIKTAESAGKDTCKVADTKLVRAVLELLKNYKYIKDYKQLGANSNSGIIVEMAKKINSIGVIRPRFAVNIDNYQKYETRYIPSKDFGILIVSTSAGVMANRDASSKGFGGRLLAYVY
jgi:small subunit ribosomal protein S8